MEEHHQPQGPMAGELGLENLDPEEIVHAAEQVARDYPHGSIAGAFAVGFLLGGGLTPRLLASLVLFVGRRYAAGAAREAVGAAVRRSASGEGEPTGVEGQPSRP